MLRSTAYGPITRMHLARTAFGRPLYTVEAYLFEVIPTPGHCPDHVCLFEREQGWLFNGFPQQGPLYQDQSHSLAAREGPP
jgi:hypothetical protein